MHPNASNFQLFEIETRERDLETGNECKQKRTGILLD